MSKTPHLDLLDAHTIISRLIPWMKFHDASCEYMSGDSKQAKFVRGPCTCEYTNLRRDALALLARLAPEPASPKLVPRPGEYRLARGTTQDEASEPDTVPGLGPTIKPQACVVEEEYESLEMHRSEDKSCQARTPEQIRADNKALRGW